VSRCSRSRTSWSVVTTVIACVGVTLLSAYAAFEVSDYRSARVISRQADTHEAIDGLYIGAAVRFCMIYEVAAVGLLVHVFPLLAIGLKRRGLLIASSLAVIGFGVVAVFLALVTRAPILAAAAATSTALGPLSVVAAMRRQTPNASGT
jgi:hypothetical protein